MTLRDPGTVKAVFTMRPFLFWRISVPVCAAFSPLIAVTANSSLRIVGLVAPFMLLPWAFYLWKTSVVVNSESATYRSLRGTRVVRLDSLKTVDTYYSDVFTGRGFTLEDTNGNRLTLGSNWWSNWGRLRKIAVGKNIPRASLREELGSYAALKLAALMMSVNLVTGGIIFAFNYFESRSFEESLRMPAVVFIWSSGFAFVLGVWQLYFVKEV